MEATITITCATEEEVEQALIWLDNIGLEAEVESRVERPSFISSVRENSIEFTDPAKEVLELPPDDIEFNDSRVTFDRETEKQKGILRETWKRPTATIAQIAGITGTSKSYTRRVLASATPELVFELTVIDPPKDSKPKSQNPPQELLEDDAYGGVVGEAEPIRDKVSREYRTVDEDTQAFRVLETLQETGPAQLNRVEAEAQLPGQPNIGSELTRLYKYKLVERSKRHSVVDNYIYWTTTVGEFLLRSHGWESDGESEDDAHRRYREAHKDVKPEDIADSIVDGEEAPV